MVIPYAERLPEHVLSFRELGFSPAFLICVHLCPSVVNSSPVWSNSRFSQLTVQSENPIATSPAKSTAPMIQCPSRRSDTIA
jgi:hypothetical protein